MMEGDLALPPDPDEALELIRRSATDSTAVLVLKLSPICGVSTMAEREVQNWLERRNAKETLRIAVIDVVVERELARGLTGRLDITHQSPQALLFRSGDVAWHGSHYDIDSKHLDELFEES